MLQKLSTIFKKHYGIDPDLIIRAPGRVNLIGEHTDYNDGFVFPMAIDRAIWIALKAGKDDEVKIHSVDYGDSASFRLGAIQKENHSWVEYIKGVAHLLQEEGYRLKGWKGVLSGDIPIGAGLSSSAALEMAVMTAFSSLMHIQMTKTEMALLGQRAENQWVGVNCGIMDQLISVAGKEGHALLIDCRSLHYDPISLPPEAQVVVLDTGVRRSLGSSTYNTRRLECEEAAEFFKVTHLRDVTLERFMEHEDELDAVVRRRARHVITENERVQKAVQSFRGGDAETFGRLMNESHRSLRDDFEVSSPELDAMVESAVSSPGCYGARMTGAGFGGCAVALIKANMADDFVQSVSHAYFEKTEINPDIYICQASDGASVIKIA